MIRMIKGTYGLVKNGTVEPMTKHSPAFSINAAREAELGSECRKIRRIHRNRRLQGFCAYYAGIIP